MVLREPFAFVGTGLPREARRSERSELRMALRFDFASQNLTQGHSTLEEESGLP